MDKAGKQYWDELWTRTPLPPTIDPTDPSVHNYPVTRFDEFFRRTLARHRPGADLLEIGCGRSQWLPYFATRFGFNVSGIDYSEVGCEQARAILAAAGIVGQVVRGDFFDPPPGLTSRFDIVISIGVAEHFDDTGRTIAAFRRFMAANGTMVTIIPNMNGLAGFVQRRLDRSLYDRHVALTAHQLRIAHERAGLEVMECGYFMGQSLAVNAVGESGPTRGRALRAALLRELVRASKLIWVFERLARPLPATPYFSPYVVCAATA